MLGKIVRLIPAYRDTEHYGITLGQLKDLVEAATRAGFTADADVLTGSTEDMEYLGSIMVRELAA